MCIYEGVNEKLSFVIVCMSNVWMWEREWINVDIEDVIFVFFEDLSNIFFGILYIFRGCILLLWGIVGNGS